MQNIGLSLDTVVHRKSQASAPEDAPVRQGGDFNALLEKTGDKADDHNQPAPDESDLVLTLSGNMADAQDPLSATATLEDRTESGSASVTIGTILSPDAPPQDAYPAGTATASPTASGMTLRASGDWRSPASGGPVKPGQPVAPTSASPVIRTLAMGADNGPLASVAEVKQNTAGLFATSPSVSDAKTMPQGHVPDGRLIPSGRAQIQGQSSPAGRLIPAPQVAVSVPNSAARSHIDAGSSVTPYAFATNSEISQRYSSEGRLAEISHTGTGLRSLPGAITVPAQSAGAALSMLNPKGDRAFEVPTALLPMGAADNSDSTIGPGVASQTGAAPALGALVPAVAPPKNTAIQVAQAISNATQDSFDIVLKPEELGRVRIYLQPSDTGLQVVIATERPETLELLRKNISSLARALSDLGHESTSFQFEQQGGGEEQGHFVPRQEGLGAGPVSEQAEELRPVTTRQILTTGLDLRF